MTQFMFSTAVRDFRTAFRERLAEWAFATIMFLLGIVFLWPGSLFERDAYAVIRVLVSENLLGWLLVFGGLIRAGILAVNGVWWPMYGFRAWMALTSMVVWLLLAAGFAGGGTIGTWAAFFPVLAVFDFFNGMRAAQDAAVRRVQSQREWEAKERFKPRVVASSNAA